LPEVQDAGVDQLTVGIVHVAIEHDRRLLRCIVHREHEPHA
jgi:hypothetical protein